MRAGLATRWASLIAAAALAAGVAQAVPVAPGETVFMPGTTLAERPDLAGTDLLGDQLLVRVGHPLEPSAFQVWWNVRQTVVRSEQTGALVFSTQLLWGGNITPGDFRVDAIWLDGWGASSTDAVYRTDLSGDRGPTWATRSADGQRLEMAFGFPLFIGNLTGDVQEDAMPIQIVTDAPAFATTGALTVVGRFSDVPGETFVGRVVGLAVPVTAPIPEPGTAALMVVGALALAGLRRRHGLRPSRRSRPVGGVSCGAGPAH
jgi:hypothetical protein